MRAFIIFMLCFPFTLQAAQFGVQIDLAKSWVEVPAKALPMKNSYLFAPKKKSKSSVVLQQIEFRPAFPDLKREMHHLCRTSFNGPGNIMREKNFSYCLTSKADKVIFLTKKDQKNYLHTFTFNNLSSDEVKGFMKNVSVR